MFALAPMLRNGSGGLIAGIGRCTGSDGALGMVYPIWGKEASLAALPLTGAQLCLQSTQESPQGLALLHTVPLPSEEQFSPPPNTIQHALSSHLSSPMCDTHHKHTREPGLRANFSLTFGVVELVQSLWWSQLPGLVSFGPFSHRFRKGC